MNSLDCFPSKFDMRAIVTSVVGAALAFHISRVAYQQGGLFAWHPVCMSLGALFISTVSIHAVRSKRSVNGIKPKTARVQVSELLYFEETKNAVKLKQSKLIK